MDQQKFQLGKKALFLTILSFITVSTWVGFEVYQASNKTTITKVTKKQMAPINPNIKTKIIERIDENLSFPQEEMDIIPVSEATVTPTAELTEEPAETTPSAETTEEESATGSSQATEENDTLE